MKKKKKLPLGQIVMFLLFLLMGAACGLAITPMLNAHGFLVSMILMLMVVEAGLFFQIALHEAGHLVFGLMTGYHFCSYRIGSFLWLKQDGRLQLKRYRLPGTGGQCIMGPPNYAEGRYPAVLYNLGGPLMNVISAALFFLLAWLCRASVTARAIFEMLALLGLGTGLSNGIPMSTGAIDNDGKNALSLGKNPKAKRAFWIQMKIAEQTAQNVRLKDMPESWFTVPADEDLDNALIAALGVFAANRLLDQQLLEESDALMAHLLDKGTGMLGLYEALLINDRIYCEVMGQNRREVVEGWLTKKQQKLMKQLRKLPNVVRTLYACALLAEQNPEQAAAIKEGFEKLARTYPYAGELEGERALMELAAQK